MNSSSAQAEVRRAAASDIAQLARLVEHYWRFENIAGYDAAQIKKLLGTLLSQPQLGAIWMAALGGEPVGYAIVTFMFSLEHRGMMAEIDELFVLPEARSQGCGARLLLACERDLGAGDFVRLQLQIERDNQPARAFYQRHGFADRAAYQLLDKALTRAAS